MIPEATASHSCAPESLLLPRLRCPDCLGEKLTSMPEEAGTLRIICQGCGRTLQMRGGSIQALPAEMNALSEANRALYDGMSKHEENILAGRTGTRNHETKMRTILEKLKIGCRGTKPVVLEVGAGYGAHAKRIVEEGCPYVGVDISPGLLAQALMRFPVLQEAGLMAADACRLPLRAASFDASFCVATLHHLPHPAMGVAEMLRVLKPGGSFCMLEPRRFYPFMLAYGLTHMETEPNFLKMSVRNLTRWAKDAGARNIRVEYSVYTPNHPAALIPIYDVIDAVCAKVAPLHLFSVVFCVYGTK